MSETLDHKTADLRQMLTGRTYPEDHVLVHQDAATDFLIKQSNEAVGRLQLLKDTEGARELQDKIDALIEKATETALTIYVKAIDSDERDLLVDAAIAKYPEEIDAFGRTKNDDDRNRYFTNLRWAAHITKVEGNGWVDTEVDVDKVVALRAGLPEYSLVKITETIDGLYTGAHEGFEQAIKETSFSSAVSRGA